MHKMMRIRRTYLQNKFELCDHKLLIELAADIPACHLKIPSSRVSPPNQLVSKSSNASGNSKFLEVRHMISAKAWVDLDFKHAMWTHLPNRPDIGSIPNLERRKAFQGFYCKVSSLLDQLVRLKGKFPLSRRGGESLFPYGLLICTILS